MNKRILVIQDHPDSGNRHLCHALEDAYAKGASAAGHDVRRIAISALDFPVLRSQEEWERGVLLPGLTHSQEAIHLAEHNCFTTSFTGVNPSNLLQYLFYN